MKKMKHFILILFIINTLSGCSQDYGQDYGPGYKFELFKNTSNWNLARAIEKDDYNKIENILKNDSNVKVNLQETVWGQTLLNLAVGNDKPRAVKILLEHVADPNIPDSLGYPALHQAAELINSRKHSAEIIKTLLEHGADPNLIALTDKVNNIPGNEYLPLMGAVGNLECAKLLLNHGANMYFKDSLDYSIWRIMLSDDLNNSESILVAKYLIVDKKMAVPNPIFFSIPSGHPRDIYYLLQNFKTHNNSEKEKAKNEILHYLKSL